MFLRAEKKAGNNVYTRKINHVTVELTIGPSEGSLCVVEENGKETIAKFDHLPSTAKSLAESQDLSFFLRILKTVIDNSPNYPNIEKIHDLIKNDAAKAIPAPSKLSSNDVLRSHWSEYSPALQNFISERLDSKQKNAEKVPKGFQTEDYEDQIDTEDFSIIEIPVRILPADQAMDLRSLEKYISNQPDSKEEPQRFKNPVLYSATEKATRANIQPARDWQRKFERAIAAPKVDTFEDNNCPENDQDSASEEPRHGKRALLPLTLLILITGGSALAGFKYPQETANFFKPVKDALMSPTQLADLPVIAVVGIALAGLAIAVATFYFYYPRPAAPPIRGVNP